MTGGCAGKQFERWIIQDFSATRAGLHNPAMPVAHVFAKADIRDDEQFRQFFLQQPDGFLNNAIAGIRTGGALVFAFRNAEQQYGRHTQRMRARCLTDKFIR